MLDTDTHLPDLTRGESLMIEAMKSRALEERRAEAEKIREHYLAERRKAFQEVTGADTLSCIELLNRAQEDHVLGPDFVLDVESEPASGRITRVPVSEIVRNPARYNGCRTLDLLEPGYDDSRPVGLLLLSGRVPRLKSFARGEADYRLEGSLPVISFSEGATREATDAALGVLRKSFQFFEFGDNMSIVARGPVTPLSFDALTYYILDEMSFEGEKRRGKDVDVVPIDPPQKLVRQLLAISSKDRGLKPLNAVASMPSIRLDGSLVNAPGYDPETRIFFDVARDAFPEISNEPSPDEARDALAVMTRLLRHFNFVSVSDRTAALCGFLTAIVRPVLDTAPMFVVEASDASSGKTALARGIGALSLGEEPAVTDAGAITDSAVTGYRR